MGAALLPLAIASAGAAAASSVAQGMAARNAANANAKIAENNAELARTNASYAAAQGEANVGNEGIKNRATAGNLRANEGAGGVDVNNGSNANTQASQAEIGQLNSLSIRSNAARAAYGFQTQAVSDEAQASADKSAGKNAITTGIIGGIGDVAKGAAAYAGNVSGSGGTSGGVSSAEIPETPDLTIGSGSSDSWDTFRFGQGLNSQSPF